MSVTVSLLAELRENC